MEKKKETYKFAKLLSVTAYPLDNYYRNKNQEYFIKFTKGHKMPEMEEGSVEENMTNAAKALFMQSNLSYVYSTIDRVIFLVKYRLKSNTGVDTLMFFEPKPMVLNAE